MTFSIGIYARDSVNIALETLVLVLTVRKTLRLKREAAQIGLQVSITNLLFQDGKLHEHPDGIYTHD